MPFHQYLTPELVRFVVSQFKLSHSGVHGPSHWMRVRRNGLELAEKTGANTGVVELFALFHDSCRVNEDTDHGHGLRGADLAQQCFDEGLLTCSLDDLKLLKVACQQHTGGTYAPSNDSNLLGRRQVGLAKGLYSSQTTITLYCVCERPYYD